MTKIMYIKASPRGNRSHATHVADFFVEECLRINPETEVLVRDLFTMDLPLLDGAMLEAKYNIMHGREHTSEQRDRWRAVERVIEDFKSANRYVFAVPMWNFSIPYHLKHFLDVISQPTYTFNAGPQGYEGLLKDKKAFVAYARGGEYPAGTPHEAFNFQAPYLEFMLGFMGITDVVTVAVEPTLGDMALRDAARDKALQTARKVAADF
ncbi:FMN-dependent NADH-azoreductase [Desulfoplanes formicivorans]|uniref:FMN dependent NADH:quinone oxidoreductase n=1 Tax=Desulfoplanes formicivorans TaxID=1592317 RepID=A0A194AM32_9BACT|nr:NAD(P)H-dependent oxidoreductase [Desulfoplanes formicivorans]GAU09709.1 FMN-dependent NADH-azoreductase [Desulfoplanes formicivorans]